jgi:hypothetical protein
MSELDHFRTTTLTRFVEAEKALHNGDPEPRLAMWSDQDPVTLFGAWGPCKIGWEEVSPVFRWLASRFSRVTDYALDLVAAGQSGDLAYTVGFERSRSLSTAAPPRRTCCASPTCSAGRTANGRSFIATATSRPRIRARPASTIWTHPVTDPRRSRPGH